MRCVIITAYVPFSLDKIKLCDTDIVVCADRGFEIAEKNGIKPHVVIGDMDSANSVPSNIKLIRCPKEKDDTDTMLCLKYGIEKGCDEFLILGGIGGRLDHTYANLQTMAYAAERGYKIRLQNNAETVYMLPPGKICIESKENILLSVFSYSQECTGLTIKGAKYPLKDFTLTNGFPLGISNEFKESTAEISHKRGLLLLMLIKRDDI